MPELNTDPTMKAAALKAAQAYVAYAESEAKWQKAKNAFVDAGRTAGRNDIPTETENLYANRATDMQGHSRTFGDALSALQSAAKKLNPNYFPKRQQGTQAAYIEAEEAFNGLLNNYIAGIAAREGLAIPENNAYFEPKSRTHY